MEDKGQSVNYNSLSVFIDWDPIAYDNYLYQYNSEGQRVGDVILDSLNVDGSQGIFSIKPINVPFLLSLILESVFLVNPPTCNS